MKRTMTILTALMLIPAIALAATVLEVGSSGANVTKVQNRLIQYGYMTGTADGKYGEKTRDAVIWFQRRNGLTADRRVGAATAAAGRDARQLERDDRLGDDIVRRSRLLNSSCMHRSAGDVQGRIAVAAVVLNRVRSSSFPNTISGVIYQTNAFSCVNNGSINNTPDNSCIRAARDAMSGWDPTGGCLYYYNPKTASDNWIRSRTVKTVIGNHSFAV